MDLGTELRERRKAAGRTIASVAMDAGLSVPYIANLENGRGNPTVAALDRLSTALGAELRITIASPSDAVEDGGTTSELGELVASSARAQAVLRRLAKGRTRRTVEQRLVATLEALAEVLPGPPTQADLDRLLDLILLSSEG
ncbi:helix-turn-helix protein [Kribbella amoyensis]|uniref:Helix-turn-helix protein n=1 Tax=Kribbella amoyensis TaxID=996641 RepID=A0A561BQ68_9ACTN|nr:helix-turn-helix transcriptional regulator [Kribbella amoyensis]TWD80954.1 helix-turn-helix protein [Kribbella amoyensis]